MKSSDANKAKYIPWIFLPAALAVGIQTVVGIFVAEILVVKVLMNNPSGSVEDLQLRIIDAFTDNVTAIMLLAYAVITGIGACIVYKKKFRDGQFSKLKGKSVNVAYTVLGILFFALAMQYVTEYLITAVSQMFPTWLEEYQELMDASGIDTSMNLLMGLYAIILGPVCEEFLFRGITFSAAKKVMPLQNAIIVQAIMFGCFHMNKIQGLYAFVLGLGLGYIMYLYDNLFITIMVHVLFNVFGTVCAEYLPVPGGNSAVVFFCSCLLALIAAYLSLVLLKKGAVPVKNEDFSADI